MAKLGLETSACGTPRAGAGAAHELGLAGAELAHERDDVPGREQPAEPRAERVVAAPSAA